MKYTLTGSDSTRKLLEQLESNMAQRGVRNAVRAAGKVMQEAVELFAPVLDEKTPGSNALDPGSLKSDIHTTVSSKDSVVTATVGPGEATGHVALWVELGHRQVHGGRSKVRPDGKSSGPGEQVGFVPAHPFIRSAFEASAEDAVAAFQATIVREVEGSGH